MALGSVMTMEDRLLETLAGPRLYSAMLLGFAGLSMTIAGVGLFGVLSFGVAQRSRELAVRSALGASPGALVSLVIRHGLAVTLAGIAGGLLLAVTLSASLKPFLFGVTEHDPLTYGMVAVVLIVVALTACIAPALRAARQDPLVVLKGN